MSDFGVDGPRQFKKINLSGEVKGASDDVAPVVSDGGELVDDVGGVVDGSIPVDVSVDDGGGPVVSSRVDEVGSGSEFLGSGGIVDRVVNPIVEEDLVEEDFYDDVINDGAVDGESEFVIDVDNVVKGRSVEVDVDGGESDFDGGGGVFTGFEEQLESLLDDEDDNGGVSLNDVSVPNGDGNGDGNDGGGNNVGSNGGGIVGGLPDQLLLPDAAKNALDDVNEKNKIQMELNRVRDSEVRKSGRNARVKPKLESGFARVVSSEVMVDGNGRLVGGDSVVSGGDVTDNPVNKKDGNDNEVSGSSPVDWVGKEKPVRERQRYTYTRGDGKLNVKELEFFRNLELSKSEVQRRGSASVLLRAPASGIETEAERKERIKRVTRAIGGKEALTRGSKFRFVQKDREVLEFLAMFRYATDKQLARMFSEAASTMNKRLRKLRLQGLVIDKKLYGARPIWFLTEAGLLVSGFDLPRVTESKLTFSMFPHQFTVNNTAGNLWGANVNVLNLKDYPSKNRVNEKGEPRFGEYLVSELEIQSSFGKLKMFEKSDVYRPQIVKGIEREFAAWSEAGGTSFGPSPEMVYGNEYMWALMPPYNIKLAYHVPDLVVKRPRNADGSPNSIAVEIEINNKPSASYEKTLRAYKADTRLYSKVVWVCKNVGPARKLETIGKEIGLWQEGRLDIVPVLTEEGVFKERDLWTI